MKRALLGVLTAVLVFTAGTVNVSAAGGHCSRRAECSSRVECSYCDEDCDGECGRDCDHHYSRSRCHTVRRSGHGRRCHR